MPNLSTILKGEITRLARKEVRAATAPVRKPYAAARRSIAELKRRVTEIEKQVKRYGGSELKFFPDLVSYKHHIPAG